MGVMPVIILLSLVVAGGFAIAFVLATQSGQYDDTQTPAMRMLFDDERRLKAAPRDDESQYDL